MPWSTGTLPSTLSTILLPWRRKKSVRLEGLRSSLKHIDEGRIFGTRAIWHGNGGILVSNIQPTMVDILDDPPLGGGIQHVADS